MDAKLTRTAPRGSIEMLSEKRRQHLLRLAQNKVTHGGSGHTLYSKWQGMKRRCYQPSCPNFKYYGARGINVCDAWRLDFSVFRDWCHANAWTYGMHIDRIDNDKGYSPENCRIVSPMENSQKRSTSKLDIKAAQEIWDSQGRHADIATKHGVSKSTVQHIKSGYSWKNLNRHQISSLNRK